jgi:hypothetical protein
MTRSTRRWRVLAAALAVLVFGTYARESQAGKEVGEFDALNLFIEFNSTDNDAGIQLFLDSDPWETLTIRDPSGKKILSIKASGGLGELGLTELFFEGGEPSPAEVLAAFPEGEYEVEARTIEGEVLVGTADLSHEFLAASVFSPSGGAVVDRNNTVVTWDAVTGAVAYEVIVESEDLGISMTFRVPASTSPLNLPLPPALLLPNTEYDIEVLAIGTNGNKTITESNFVTGP